MKSFGIYWIFFIMLLSFSASGQKISFAKKQITIKQLFREITKQTGYSIFYSDTKISQKQRLNVNFQGSSLEDVLAYVIKEYSLSYKISGQNIIFSKINGPDLRAGLVAEVYAEGRVLDRDGLPVPGATIKVKGEAKSSISDNNGKFIIKNLKKTSVLATSYIGYVPKEIRVGSGGYMDIVIESENAFLDEVKVVAYGRNTERYNRGNVNTISAEEISRQPVANFLQVLQGGQVPGIIVGQTNGFPSAPFEVSIRGKSEVSLVAGFADRNKVDPLYIIDGTPITIGSGDSFNHGVTQNDLNGPAIGQSELYAINPADIESISILKDGDATAIYGARAANGAILVTTKKGQPGKPVFDFVINGGLSLQADKFKLMDTKQYLAMREQAFKSDGIQQTDSNAYDLRIWDPKRYTDWQKKILGTAYLFEGELGVSGGSERTIYRLSGGRKLETLPFPGNFSEQRNSLAMSLNHFSKNRKFGVKFRSNYSYLNSILPGEDPTKLIFLPPNAPPIFDDNGKRNLRGWGYGLFPSDVSKLEQHYHATTNYLTSNLGFSYQISPNLNIGTSFGYSITNQNQLLHRPIYNSVSTSPVDEQRFPGRNQSTVWIIEPGINYRRTLGAGELETFVGATLQSSTGQGTGTNPIAYDPVVLELIGSVNNGYYTKTRYQSFYLRINYEYLKRYLFTVNSRIDGSSRYGINKSLGTFGSVAAAWILSEEDFFKGWNSLFSFVKLRTSYGITGGDGGSDYLTLTMSKEDTPYGGVNSFIRFKAGNSDISPVIDRKFETALDLGLFKGRMLLSLSAYLNRTGNQLVTYDLPAMTGFSSVKLNVPAVVQNKGLELTLRGNLIITKRMEWSTLFSLGIIRNELKRFPDLEMSKLRYIYAVGQPIDRLGLFHYLGVDPSNGQYLYDQPNKDNLAPEKDYIYKNTDPVFSGALQNNISYKNFTLSILFSFSKQNGIQNLANGVPGSLNNGLGNQPLQSFPRLTTDQEREDILKYARSDVYWSDASYIRLQNLSLAYKMPVYKKFPSRPLSCKVFVQGQNLFTFTGYKGSDVTRPYVLFSLPPRRLIVGGLQLNF